MARAIEVKSFINDRQMSARQWLLVVLCFLIVFCDGIDVAIMGFLAPAISAEMGVSKSEFGLVMGAAPIGLAIGAILAGSSSDIIGRRKVLLGSVAAFGTFTLLASYVNSLHLLLLFRFITGLGLGAAMPNTTTLLSEYVPQKRRSLLLATMFTGFNFGSAAIGFAAAAILPHYGWRGVLFFGGTFPLALLIPLIFLLPESVRYMVVRKHSADKIRRVLASVCVVKLDNVTHFTLDEEKATTRQPVGLLFSKTFILRTFTLWTCYFMGLLVIYLTTSWLPSMIRDAGISMEVAANVTAMFQLGGTIGAVIVGIFMHYIGAKRAIAASYLLGALALILLGVSGLQSAALPLIVAAVGFFMSGGQTGLNAYAPGCYPTFARATGVSWMLGIGRFGSILGSSIGGLLLSGGWDFKGIFTILAIPAVLGAISISMNALERQRSGDAHSYEPA